MSWSADLLVLVRSTAYLVVNEDEEQGFVAIGMAVKLIVRIVFDPLETGYCQRSRTAACTRASRKSLLSIFLNSVQREIDQG